jgi:peptide chain release factor 1
MMQEDRSQNRAKAMAILRPAATTSGSGKMRRAPERRGQVGSGDRSERIRTYNFRKGA